MPRVEKTRLPLTHGDNTFVRSSALCSSCTTHLKRLWAEDGLSVQEELAVFYELAPNHFSGFKEEERILVAPWLYDGSLLAFVSSCDDLTQLGPLQSVHTPYTNS